MNPKPRSKPKKHHIRNIILNYIQIHPGAPFKTIISIVGIPEGTLRYHLRYLEKLGSIRCDSQKREYYPSEFGRSPTLTDNQERIIHTIKNQPGITLKDISIKTLIKPSALRTIITPLIQMNLLTCEKQGRKVHYSYIPPEVVERKKMVKLITKLLTNTIDEETYWIIRKTYAGSSKTSMTY